MSRVIQMPTDYESESWYRSLSLIDLIGRIVYFTDPRALAEFHNNRIVFRYSRNHLLCIDFMNKLRESAARSAWPGHKALDIADMAYDFTVDKFINLPQKTELRIADKKNAQNLKHYGPDCRLYYKAFLRYMNKSFKEKRPNGQLEEEGRAAKALQYHVRRQFYLSRLEAERKFSPFRSRYYWIVKGKKICVWLPVSLKGRKRRLWLENNIDDPDPFQPEERKRIQAIIDLKLIKEGFIPLNEKVCKPDDQGYRFWFDLDEEFGISLANAVAEEKAVNIKKQRPSVKSLGEERLKRMVLHIFKDIESGEYKDGKVAKKFGFTKATFSRFAGSRWLQAGSSIPDLWLNTAQVISNHSIFKKTAKDTGVWKQVKATLGQTTINKGNETNHDKRHVLSANNN